MKGATISLVATLLRAPEGCDEDGKPCIQVHVHRETLVAMVCAARDEVDALRTEAAVLRLYAKGQHDTTEYYKAMLAEGRVEMYILELNDMRMPQVEMKKIVCAAETRAELADLLRSERVPHYSDGQWNKCYRKGGPLEWCNPPMGTNHIRLARDESYGVPRVWALTGGRDEQP